MRRKRREPEPQPKQIRCAIYTRKSTEEGLEQDFNSLDAQREGAENYIASQKAEGWVCLPDRYDDGGFTGGNMERPALRRLMADIDAGRVDCVVVYKVDRLSRSLMDFAKMMETFDKHKVSFVSVTQQFNTDPKDRIAAVEVQTLRLDLPCVKSKGTRRRITVSANSLPEAPKAVYRLLHEAINKEHVRLGEVHISQAKFRMAFEPTDGQRPRTLTFDVTYPDRCTLRDDPYDQVAKKYLKEWGIACA